MKNDDFRKFVSETPSHPGGGLQADTSNAFGTKKSSFLGKTPRPGKAVSSDDFARQVRERHASFQATKKFKSAAPKGTKFAAGYTDRAKARQDAKDDEDDRARRIKALEEQVKLGQLSEATFEALRDEITGGDASSTHLVKGLDRKLLERVRRGEDVLGLSGANSEEAHQNVDDELDKLEEKEVQVMTREKDDKRGVKAAAAAVKRSRNDILAELKAQRKAAADANAAAAPIFDSRWRKVGAAEQPRIEIDHKGREVLITVDEDGKVKKKTRKIPGGAHVESNAAVQLPDATKPVLGSDVVIPEQMNADPEEEDDDIFEGVGTDYNPLRDLEDDDTEDDGKDKGDATASETADPTIAAADAEAAHIPRSHAMPELHEKRVTPHDYFKDGKTIREPEEDRFKGIENVLKKAARIQDTSADRHDEQEPDDERAAKRAKMLSQRDRDLDDMDMGFGSSRYEDEEESGGAKVRFSQWEGGATTGDDGWEEGGGADEKKKRKRKKRKGDVNNAADIMRVIEGRKAGGTE